MSLREAFQKATVTAFKAIGDVPESSTYTSIAVRSYNTSTSTPSTTGDVDYEDVDFVYSKFSENEIDDKKVRSTDEKALIPTLNLTPNPKKGDYITKSDGTKWRVEGIRTDPTRALWKLQIRKP